jgi:hypothetical protein
MRLNPDEADFYLELVPEGWWDRLLIWAKIRKPRKYFYSLDPAKNNYPW